MGHTVWVNFGPEIKKTIEVYESGAKQAFFIISCFTIRLLSWLMCNSFTIRLLSWLIYNIKNRNTRYVYTVVDLMKYPGTNVIFFFFFFLASF